MKAKEVTYSRKFNLGNYETEDIGVTLVLDNGEKATDAIAVARKLVLQQASLEVKAKSSKAVELEELLTNHSS